MRGGIHPKAADGVGWVGRGVGTGPERGQGQLRIVVEEQFASLSRADRNKADLGASPLGNLSLAVTLGK